MEANRKAPARQGRMLLKRCPLLLGSLFYMPQCERFHRKGHHLFTPAPPAAVPHLPTRPQRLRRAGPRGCHWGSLEHRNGLQLACRPCSLFYRNAAQEGLSRSPRTADARSIDFLRDESRAPHNSTANPFSGGQMADTFRPFPAGTRPCQIVRADFREML